MRGAGLVWVIAMSLAGAMPASAQERDGRLPGSQEQQARLDATGVIGRLIFDYDRAAWVATDAMRAAVPPAEAPPAGGWVVLPGADGALVVTFYGTTEAGNFGFFEAITRDGRVVEGHRIADADRIALTPVQTRMVEALTVVRRRSAHRPCAPWPFNTVVLPPATADAPVTVYLLTPQVKHGDFPFGGHFRIDVDKDGRVVVDRAFTTSCLTMSPAPGSVAVGVTHLLDPQPTEIHVFLSIWMGMPLAVATADNRLWMVDGERIRLISPDTVPAPR